MVYRLHLTLVWVIWLCQCHGIDLYLNVDICKPHAINKFRLMLQIGVHL